MTLASSSDFDKPLFVDIQCSRITKDHFDFLELQNKEFAISVVGEWQFI